MKPELLSIVKFQHDAEAQVKDIRQGIKEGRRNQAHVDRGVKAEVGATLVSVPSTTLCGSDLIIRSCSSIRTKELF